MNNRSPPPLRLTITLTRRRQRAKTDTASQLVGFRTRRAVPAGHDCLTRLPNRALFLDRLTTATQQAQRFGYNVCLVLLDLDAFTAINETSGHQVGDQLLRATARRLQSLVDGGDTVARLGSDTFALVLQSVAGRHLAHPAIACVLDAVSAPLSMGGRELSLTASAGVACYPHDGMDGAALLRHAEMAQQQARLLGRNRVQFFSEELHTLVNARHRIAQHLRHALSQQEFTLLFQPRVGKCGQVLAMEALLRWSSPVLGAVPPTQFIPVAEESGDITALGNWVLNAACRQNKAWQDAGLAPVSIAVNVSVHQFEQPDFVALVSHALETSAMAPHYLELELTESVRGSSMHNIAQTLDQLRAMGVGIAIDDFGTGYASLSYLHRLPVDYVKIDQSFIRELGDAPASGTIVDATIALGHSLGLRVIAEGVETAQQLAHLLAQGCDEIQGNYYSVPLTPSDAAQLLADGRFA